jgi:ethanolamine utilization protein EutP
MVKTKFLFVGSRGCGKTTLILALLDQYDENMRILPTQCLNSYGPYIDLPGNYCDNPACYPILSVCAQQAQIVILVMAADQSILMPEGFVHLFIRPVLGVITKKDAVNADCERAELYLHRTGVKDPIYSVSAQTGEGIDFFRQFLEKKSNRYTGNNS